MLYPQEGGWCKIPAFQAPPTDLKVFCFKRCFVLNLGRSGSESGLPNSDELFDGIRLLKQFKRRNTDL